MEDIVVVISPQEMQQQFAAILQKEGFSEERALRCAKIFTINSVDGVYTHGVNRFPRFVKYIKEKHIVPEADPILKNTFGAVEQWDGQLGAGITNALFCTDR